MRFFIFLLDTFIITVIANGIVDWRHRYHSSKGYFLMLYMCGIWMAFLYSLQYLHAFYPQYVYGVLSIPILIAVIFGKRYIHGRWQNKTK